MPFPRWGVRRPRHGTRTALRPRPRAKPPTPTLRHAGGRESAQRIGREHVPCARRTFHPSAVPSRQTSRNNGEPARGGHDRRPRKGCSCGGRLHSANYPRAPRGGPDHLPEEYRSRFSFCCDRDGCRKRMTPPSVRFLGRKVYLGAVVILVSAMRQGPTPRRVRELSTLC